MNGLNERALSPQRDNTLSMPIKQLGENSSGALIA